MKKIGLLSDTHSGLDDSFYKFFENCDELWHAGDIGSTELYDKLNAYKPLKAVYGNIDNHELRTICSENLRFRCEEVDVWITHIGGYPPKYDSRIIKELKLNPPNLFICGHSHILRVMFDKKYNLLYMNPGAAGNYGFHTIRTALRFDINNSEIENLEILEKPR